MILLSLAESWYYFVGGIVLLAGGIFAFYKLRPETTRILVESAKVTVEMSDGLRDDLASQVTALTKRLERMEGRVDAADRRAENAEQRATELAGALETERIKVQRLQKAVAALREEMARHNIVIKPELEAILDT